MGRKVVIIGASGRDYHNFNMVFRNNPEYRVVAFLQTQIPGVSGRRYPPSLAGELYPDGIPIISLEKLEDIVETYGVDEAVLAYSDLTYSELGSVLSRILSRGLSFRIIGPSETMLESSKPVIAVLGVKTGVGKSTVHARWHWSLRGVDYAWVLLGIQCHMATWRNLQSKYFTQWKTSTGIIVASRSVRSTSRI
jgi:predicted GTPase